jgi:3-methyladenine DNA glycosylase Tag
MTDEERQKLYADLRLVCYYANNDKINKLIWQAADEIERLSKENDSFRRALNDAWRKIEEDEAILNPERSVS